MIFFLIKSVVSGGKHRIA